MAVYYHDLVLLGSAYRQPVFGHNEAPAYCDDLFIVPSFPLGTPVSVDCSTAALALAGNSATIFAATTVSCGVGVLTLVGLQASIPVSDDTNVDCTVGVLALVGLQCHFPQAVPAGFPEGPIRIGWPVANPDERFKSEDL